MQMSRTVGRVSRPDSRTWTSDLLGPLWDGTMQIETGRRMESCPTYGADALGYCLLEDRKPSWAQVRMKNPSVMPAI